MQRGVWSLERVGLSVWDQRESGSPERGAEHAEGLSEIS